MKWLESSAAAPAITGLSEIEPPRGSRDQAARVTIGDIGEDLETIPSRVAQRIVYDGFPLPDRGPARLRAEVIRRLDEAQSALPDGFGLTILDGYRPPEYQVALIAHYRDADPELEDGYVADPDDQAVLPPHTTGGAVDLTLSWRGAPLALGTDFDAFSSDSHLLALETGEHRSDPALEHDRSLRRLLASVMRGAGFAPIWLEWWHWSYGDQWWAAEYGHPRSLYSQRV